MSEVTNALLTTYKERVAQLEAENADLRQWGSEYRQKLAAKDTRISELEAQQRRMIGLLEHWLEAPEPPTKGQLQGALEWLQGAQS